MPREDMATVCGYVPQEVKAELEELLTEGETISKAVAAAVRTEIKLRRRALDHYEAHAADPSEEDVSRETS